jgi:hypothetical protein
MYQNIKLNISKGQADKIKKAITKQNWRQHKTHSFKTLDGEHVLAVTKTQLNKIKKAYDNGKGVTLTLSKTQLMHNAKSTKEVSSGALLPLLGMLGSTLATKVVPALATGLLSGVGASAGSTLIDKIAGRGIVYLNKNGKGMKLTAAGSGLYLRPWSKNVNGDGLFLKTGKGYESVGSGLLLGPNSPFSSIPFLGAILVCEIFYLTRIKNSEKNTFTVPNFSCRTKSSTSSPTNTSNTLEKETIFETRYSCSDLRTKSNFTSSSVSSPNLNSSQKTPLVSIENTNAPFSKTTLNSEVGFIILHISLNLEAKILLLDRKE